VRGLEELVIAAQRKRLRVGERLLKAAGEFIHAHGNTWDVEALFCGDKPQSVQEAAACARSAVLASRLD